MASTRKKVAPVQKCKSKSRKKATPKIKHDGDDAKWVYKRMVKYICEFEDNLNDDQEIGASLVSTDNGTTFHIDDMGYWEPDLITFEGEDPEGNRVKLIQHISQLNVALVAVPKQTTPEQPEAPARRIGFHLVGKGK